MKGFRALFLKLAAGAFVPVKTSSRLYLERALAQFGVEGLPKPALQELADDAVRLAKIAARLRKRGWREGLTNWLDGRAGNVACLLHDERDAAGRQRVTEDLRESLTAILEKHGVTVAPADSRLERLRQN